MNKLPVKEFKKIYSKVPRLCVEVLVNEGNGTLLTLRQIDPSGVWHLPGGTVLLGELLENAVKRVAKEELGINVKVQELVGVVDNTRYMSGGHTVALVYKVKPLNKKIKLNEQASEYGYFKTPPQKTFPIHKPFVR